MIVMDEDRGKPIHITASIVACLANASCALVLLLSIAAALCWEICSIGLGGMPIHVVRSVAAHPFTCLGLAAVVVGPLPSLLRGACWWRVDVSDGVLIQRSPFRRRAVPTADIVRVAITGRTGDGYKLIFKDGTAIRMDDMALGSKLDLARFEDEVVCRIPQVEMERRLFTRIRRRGYTEYL